MNKNKDQKISIFHGKTPSEHIVKHFEKKKRAIVIPTFVRCWGFTQNICKKFGFHGKTNVFSQFSFI